MELNIQQINNGQFVTDPGAEEIYESFEKTKSNFNTVKGAIEGIWDVIAESPIYVQPTLSISLNNLVLERGSNININFVLNFIQNDAGPVVNYQLLINNIIDNAQNNLPNVNLIHQNLQNNLLIRGRCFFSEGLTKINNLNVLDPTGKILAGQIDSLTRTITCRNRQFFGSVNSIPTNDTQIRSLQSNFDNENSITIFANTIRIVLYIPSNKNLQEAKTTNNQNITSEFTSSIITINDLSGNPMNYKRLLFVTTLPLNVNINITLN
jgi:hypothetical protein